jgi:hypothetical protein
MDRRMPIISAKLVALLFGAGLATATVLGVVGYVVFMIMWMHAPAIQVLLLSSALAAPLLLLAWGAMRIGGSRTGTRE